MNGRVTVDRTTLQIVFDVAVNSLDFGSGFLDDEEVAALRTIAESLGVDPMVATPETFQCKYTGQHMPYPDEPLYAKSRGMCCRCRRPLDSPNMSPRCEKFRPYEGGDPNRCGYCGEGLVKHTGISP